MTVNKNILESVELSNGTTLYVQSVSNTLYLTTNALHLEVVTQLTRQEMKTLVKAINAVLEQGDEQS